LVLASGSRDWLLLKSPQRVCLFIRLQLHVLSPYISRLTRTVNRTRARPTPPIDAILSKPTSSNAPGPPAGAGSKRGSEAVAPERNSGKKPHEVSHTPKFFSMLPRLLCCTHLNARLQCDLGCPAVLAARIYSKYAPCQLLASHNTPRSELIIESKLTSQREVFLNTAR
jgi:hypothetical protein